MKRGLQIFLFINILLGNAQKPQLIYIADPLCSWCYGFQVEMDPLINKYKEVLDIKIIVGGLGIGEERKIDHEFKESLKDHWSQVAQETGQIFSDSTIKIPNLVYNSEPICRAIVTIREIDSTKAILAHKTFQKQFYQYGENVTQKDIIRKCVLQLGIDVERFNNLYESNEMIVKTLEDFKKVENNGIEGYPVLILVKDNKTILISEGYQKLKKLDKKIQKELR